MITPAEYADQYRNMKVGLDGGVVNVTIERYHIGDPDAEKDQLIQAIKEHYRDQFKKVPGFGIDLIVNGMKVTMRDLEALKMHVAAPFSGKGSPEECQLAAQLAVMMKRTSKEQLPRYCEKHLGLDCNGFVGNYIFHIRDESPWQLIARNNVDIGPSSSMNQFLPIGMAVSDTKTVNPAYMHLFIEVDAHYRIIPGGKAGAGHIAISEPNKYNPHSFVSNSFGGLDLGYARKGAYGHPALWAVESTGPQGAVGLKESWYALKGPITGTKARPVPPGIFEVFRGSKASNLNFMVLAVSPC